MADNHPKSAIIGPIYSRGKAGFLNWSGEWVIEPQYECLGALSEGLISFVADGKLGFLDEAGKVVIPPHFDSDLSSFDVQFNDGLACVTEHNATGYIDKTGNWVIPPRVGAMGYHTRERLSTV
ncbi:MAG TPA: WG repeat-containing protein [Methylomirabilota bacterium]|nr:WG repeat-containing protein [Methylomirabilota bacterium]